MAEMTPASGAAEPQIPLRVAELLSSRLCHDLISPAAAISNGLELVDDGHRGLDADVMSLLTFSAA